MTAAFGLMLITTYMRYQVSKAGLDDRS